MTPSDFPINIEVESYYLPEHSDEIKHQYTFGYTVTITNQGEQSAQLLSRHWEITDGNGELDKVDGEGVVGQQPKLPPGKSFRYSSRVVLGTQVGVMCGNYTWLDENGQTLSTPIPTFRLAKPNSLH